MTDQSPPVSADETSELCERVYVRELGYERPVCKPCGTDWPCALWAQSQEDAQETSLGIPSDESHDRQDSGDALDAEADLIDAMCSCGHRVFPDWHNRYGCTEDDCDCLLRREQALLASDWLAERERAAAERAWEEGYQSCRKGCHHADGWPCICVNPYSARPNAARGEGL